MSATSQFVVFKVHDQRCGVAAGQVERIVRAVEVAPLPQAPDFVEGAINVAGVIVPVFNVRRRCGLPTRDIQLSDHLIVARASRRLMALLVDSVEGLVELRPDAIAAAREVVPELEFVRGIAKLPTGLILLHDLERFVDEQEEQALARALSTS